jgi:hypothetical protein
MSYMNKITLILTILLIFTVFDNNISAEDQLTIYVFKSPNGIEWKTPKKLLHSVLSNAFSFKNRMIGHVAVELECDDGLRAGPVRVLTGMSYVDKHIYKKQLLWENKGFSVIFGSVAGRLEETKDLKIEIKQKSNTLGSPRLTFIKYLISPQTCRRLENYHREYREKKYYKNYGLPNNPRKGEGAGCSAFGMSFLELAGLLSDSDKNNWSLTKRVSMDLLGGEGNLHNPKKSVSFLDVLFMSDNQNRWISESESGRSVFFYDPDLIFSWIKNKIKKKSIDQKIITINKMEGLLYDKRNVPTPSDPIWLNN